MFEPADLFKIAESLVEAKSLAIRVKELGYSDLQQLAHLLPNLEGLELFPWIKRDLKFTKSTPKLFPFVQAFGTTERWKNFATPPGTISLYQAVKKDKIVDEVHLEWILREDANSATMYHKLASVGIFLQEVSRDGYWDDGWR